MPHFVVATHFVWSDYPGLRAGKLYAGKPDISKRPAGESHLLEAPDATEPMCGLSRTLFPHDFGDTDSISSDKSTRCTACQEAA
jgi:hypothetical protein